MRLNVGLATALALLAATAGGAAAPRSTDASTSTASAAAAVASTPANASSASPAGPCPPVPPDAAAAAGLTPQEAADLCWWGEDQAEAEEGGGAWPSRPSTSSDSPVPGVACTPATWCDSAGRCSPVCGRGTVAVPPWLTHALATQEALAAASGPLCDAVLPGSHNAAITLADGYGALDPAFSSFFTWIRWVRPGSVLRTHNQALSLTDQLRLGVRAVELDVHWVAGGLRIAHCGGLASPALDRLVAALNAAARLLRRPFKWDVETVGCSPSLSSIPAGDQRPFADAVAEVGAWLGNATGGGQHSARVVVIYLDNQPDLAKWGALPALQAQLEAGLPPGSIYTPADHAKWVAARTAAAAAEEGRPQRRWRGRLSRAPPPGPPPPPQAWPSGAALATVGKRVVIVSGTDYGPAMAGFAFPRSGDGGMCGWAEPPLAGFDGPPACDAECGARAGCAPGEGRRAAGGGRLMRLVSCELQYGPLNCEFEWRGDNEPILDEGTLPRVSACAVNMPSPDAVTPARAAAGVWSWADGQPFSAPAPPPPLPPTNPIARAAAAVAAWVRRVILRRPDPPPPPPGAGLCGLLSSAAGGRWVAAPCDGAGGPPRPPACRPRGAAGPGAHAPAWVLPPARPGGAPPRGAAACPPGHDWAAPRDARDAAALAAAVAAVGGLDGAWLPLQGPDWAVPTPDVREEAAALAAALGSGGGGPVTSA